MEPLTTEIDLLSLAKQNGIDITLNDQQLQLKLPKNQEIDKGPPDELRKIKQLIIDFLTKHKKVDNKSIARQNGAVDYNLHSMSECASPDMYIGRMRHRIKNRKMKIEQLI